MRTCCANDRTYVCANSRMPRISDLMSCEGTRDGMYRSYIFCMTALPQMIACTVEVTV